LITAATIKYIQSLRLGKFRQKYNKFIVEGDKCAIEFLKANTYNIDAIYASDDWVTRHSHILAATHYNLEVIDSKEMKKISQLKTPTDVLLLCDKPVKDINVSLKNESILYLDGLQNPGNLGTIIRTADWYAISPLPILGTSLEGNPIDRNANLVPCILVIGNEGQGIRESNMPYIDQKILIEGTSNKIAESLNAGIAAAIVLDRLFG